MKPNKIDYMAYTVFFICHIGQPETVMPPWLRNRVGVHIVEAGAISGSRPARPVYIDNDNRQVSPNDMFGI